SHVPESAALNGVMASRPRPPRVMGRSSSSSGVARDKQETEREREAGVQRVMSVGSLGAKGPVRERPSIPLPTPLNRRRRESALPPLSVKGGPPAYSVLPGIASHPIPGPAPTRQSRGSAPSIPYSDLPTRGSEGDRDVSAGLSFESDVVSRPGRVIDETEREREREMDMDLGLLGRESPTPVASHRPMRYSPMPSRSVSPAPLDTSGLVAEPISVSDAPRGLGVDDGRVGSRRGTPRSRAPGLPRPHIPRPPPPRRTNSGVRVGAPGGPRGAEPPLGSPSFGSDGAKGSTMGEGAPPDGPAPAVPESVMRLRRLRSAALAKGDSVAASVSERTGW
ncbi:hypothetical protein KIPB_002623, partial [Kipferlia bialata]